ncbi:MAG: ComEC/Rec2 family competence protein, partial [Verrucomicrobiota bacterium]
MKRPLIGLAILYAAGIGLGTWVTGPLGWWLVGATSLLVAFFFWGRLPLLFVAVFVTGIFMCRSFQTETSPRHVLNLLGRAAQPVGLRGVVRCDTAGRRSFELEVEAVRTGTVWQVAEGRVFVFVRATAPAAAHRLQYGDRIEFSAFLRTPTAPRNPGSLDWARWLGRRRIYHTAAINESDTCVVLESDRGNPLWALSLRLRDRFEKALHKGLENEPKLAGVLAGMVIGERAEIPPDTYAAFQRTGVFHIFSVSGLNVTLVGVVVLGVLRGLRVPRRWSGLACIPALALYVLATGALSGAVRTLVMASVLLVGWALVRPVDLRNSLAAAALVILVLDPLQLFDGGFILSFGAVTALVVLTPPIEERLLSWIKLDPLRPAVLTTGWQRGAVGAAQMVARAVSGSLAAWVGLLPLMAVYFNLFSPVSVLANVVVIPVLGVITWLGMLAGAAFGWWNWLTLTLNNANFFFLAALIRCVEWLGRLPAGYWFVLTPPDWWVVGYYSWLALLLTHRRKWLVLAAAPLLGLALWAGKTPPEITVFDLS